MRTGKHIITLLALALSLGATAACKKKDGKTTTPGDNNAVPSNPDTASKEAKQDFAAVAARYKSAKDRGALSKGTCDELSNAFEGVYKKYGPQMAVAKFNSGAVWEECGDTEKAEKIYEALVRDVPKYDLAYNNLGVIYWNRKQESRALDFFKKAVDANATTRAPRNNLAAALRNKYTENPQQSDFDSAEKQLQNVLAVDSGNRLAYENLARLYYDRGRLKDKSYLLLADLVVTQAIQVLKKDNTESADIFNIKGLLFMQEDNQIEALRAFKKGVEINKNHTDAHMNIAMIAIRFRDYKSAEESINVALKDQRQKKNVEAYLGLGVALRGQRKYSDAESAFKKAQDLKGSDPRALYNLGILYHEHIGPATEAKSEGAFDKKPYEKAKDYFGKFVSQASGKKDLDRHAADAKARISNIDDYFKNIEEMKKLEAEAAKLAELAKKQEEEEKARLRKMEEDLMKESSGGGTPPPAAKPDPAKPDPAKPDPAKPDPAKPAAKPAK